jgi:glycosyltransferase involved in cell wall biosynthesis
MTCSSFVDEPNKRIAIVLPDLRGGGAEVLRLRLAKALAEKGYQPEFWLRRLRGELLSTAALQFPVFDLKASRIRSMFRPLLQTWQERQPVAVLVDMWPNTVVGALCFWLLKLRKKIGVRSRLMLCDHNTLSLTPEAQGWFRRQVMGRSIAFSYPCADTRVAVSNGVADDLVAISGIPRAKFEVIYNCGFSSIEDDELENPWPPGKLKLLMVGSLKKQKHHRLAIEALAKLNRPDICLAIVGEGGLRSSLEELARDLGVENKVLMPGFEPNVQRWYRHADVFMLTSRWEGFGIVLLEALQNGLQIVSTDCRSGPAEILENGRYGRLVPVGDSDALVRAIQECVTLPIPAEQLKQRASDFSLDRIADQYIRLLFPH